MTKLVTIATFDEGAKARLAQNVLQAAGIKAAVADETLVAMDWLLSNAVGGVKVQVLEEDAERAVAVLNETLGDDGPEPLATSDSPKQAPLPPDDFEDEDDDPPQPPPDPESREETARRMVFAAILSLFVCPIAFYAMYLFLNAAFGEGPLSGRGRMNIWVGGACILVGLIETFAWLAYLS